jgi:hypothetical protein
MTEIGKGYGTQRVENLIFTIRGYRVLLDVDLARVYGVSTKRLNEQVKRNKERFPGDFAFQLKGFELTHLKSQFATSSLGAISGHGGPRKLPWVFTEHGAIMAATVLNAPRAVRMSLFVVRAFVRVREMLAAHRGLARQLDLLEKKVAAHDHKFQEVFEAIRALMREPEKPKRHIGFTAEEKKAVYRA